MSLANDMRAMHAVATNLARRRARRCVECGAKRGDARGIVAGLAQQWLRRATRWRCCSAARRTRRPKTSISRACTCRRTCRSWCRRTARDAPRHPGRRRRVKAAAAQVGVATAQLFPSLSLSASMGQRRLQLADRALGRGRDVEHRRIAVAADLSWRRPARRSGARRRRPTTPPCSPYKQTVLAAFQNVANTLGVAGAGQPGARLGRDSRAARRKAHSTMPRHAAARRDPAARGSRERAAVPQRAVERDSLYERALCGYGGAVSGDGLARRLDATGERGRVETRIGTRSSDPGTAHRTRRQLGNIVLPDTSAHARLRPS